MEVDGVLSWREIVEFDFESNARSLIPNDNVADRFALRIFQFDFSFGRARGCEGNQRDEHSEDRISNGFHGFDPPGSTNYSQSRRFLRWAVMTSTSPDHHEGHEVTRRKHLQTNPCVLH